MTALKIMLVAGEASGDALGAKLARALKDRLGPAGVTFIGVGGREMAAEGVESPFDIAELSLWGLAELVTAAPRVLRRIDQTVRLALDGAPDVVVLIDSWGFTIRVAKRLRRRAAHLPLVKYVAPQVWATRPGRARELAGLVDHLLTLLAFEAPLFEAEGLPTTFVGNPVLAWDVSRADPAAWRRRGGIAPDAPVLLLLPGSRPGEVDRLMPVFADAAARLKAGRPSLELALLAADTVAGRIRAAVDRWPHPPRLVEGDADKLDAMSAATAAIACSGTVTTELAMAGCPMVVAYRVAPFTAAVARLLIRTPYVTLFNIAAGAFVAPEFIQERCTGPLLAEGVAGLLDDPDRRASQAAAQSAALAKLGPGAADPSRAAAEAVLRVLAERRRDEGREASVAELGDDVAR